MQENFDYKIADFSQCFPPWRWK